MATQQQHAPIQEEAWLAEEEEPKQQNSEKKKRKRSLSILAGGFVALLVGYAGIFSYNCIPFLVNHDQAKDSYLPLSDYVLYDEDQEQDGSYYNPFYDGNYSFAEKELYTSKGLTIGDSWESFVEKYGDYYSDSIFVYREDEEDDTRRHFYDDMRLKDFDEEYVQTGEVSLEEDEISVYFEVMVKGNQIAFSLEDKNQLYSLKYGSRWPSGSVMNPRIQSYTLDISYTPYNWWLEDNGIYYISVSRYVSN